MPRAAPASPCTQCRRRAWELLAPRDFNCSHLILLRLDGAVGRFSITASLCYLPDQKRAALRGDGLGRAGGVLIPVRSLLMGCSWRLARAMPWHPGCRRSCRGCAAPSCLGGHGPAATAIAFLPLLQCQRETCTMSLLLLLSPLSPVLGARGVRRALFP